MRSDGILVLTIMARGWWKNLLSHRCAYSPLHKVLAVACAFTLWPDQNNAADRFDGSAWVKAGYIDGVPPRAEPVDPGSCRRFHDPGGYYPCELVRDSDTSGGPMRI